MIGFRQRWHGWLLGASVFALIGLPVPRASYAQDPYGQEAVRYEDPGESTYSREAYVSELEGSASLDDAAGGQPLELNQPLEPGARVHVFRDFLLAKAQNWPY